MLKQLAEGIWTHESECLLSNTVIVQGRAGVLLIDPGLTGDELLAIADGLDELGLPVAAGFSTHPHWDHVLWHARFGNAPRYGTARGAADIRDFLANPEWRHDIVEEFPPEIAADVPLELLGLLTGLPAGTALLPWDGPTVRIIEHRAHSPGHAALLLPESRILVAGDMLSDVLVPMPDAGAADSLGDYLAALSLFEAVADDVDTVVPGHGTIGGPGQLGARIALDRAYVRALREGTVPDDPRIGPAAAEGWDWVAGIYEWQAEVFAARRVHDGNAPGDDGARG